MFSLYLPYLIAMALGIDPTAPGAVAEAAEAEIAAEMAAGSGDDASDRTPEDQTPTGKFTTATEVKPILGMTQANWVAVREFNGEDLVYFTHLLAWRCGLWDIQYGLNGQAPTETFPMEPCNEGTATPNALTQVEDFLPYIVAPLGSVERVTVRLTYDDGTTEEASFDRGGVLIP